MDTIETWTSQCESFHNSFQAKSGRHSHLAKSFHLSEVSSRDNLCDCTPRWSVHTVSTGKEAPGAWAVWFNHYTTGASNRKTNHVTRTPGSDAAYFNTDNGCK